MESIGKMLIIFGIVLMVLGLFLVMFEKLPFGIGKLPGDIYIKKDHFVFYFPIVSSIIISIVLTVLINVILKLLNK